jgi:hypothetical protein
METLVLHTILDTDLGQFFVCLIMSDSGVELSCHKIEMSNGIEVIFPAQELDEETRTNLINKLMPVMIESL